MDIPDWQIEGTMEHAQYEALVKSLDQAQYRVAIAAATLRVGRSTVYRLMRRYEIDVPDKVEESSPEAFESPLQQPVRDGLQQSSKAMTADIIFDGTNYLLRKR